MGNRGAGLQRTWLRKEQWYIDALQRQRPARLRTHRRTAVPVLVTAPHAGTQLRDARLKYADRGTGGLAEALAGHLRCSSISVGGLQPDDPNWDQTVGPFKAAMRPLLGGQALVVDLHAMRRERGIDICLGTGTSSDPQTRAFVEYWADMARRRGLRVNINTPFSARHPGTITSFVQAQGGRAIQVEISAALLDPNADWSVIQPLAVWLAAMIRAAGRLELPSPSLHPPGQHAERSRGFREAQSRDPLHCF